MKSLIFITMVVFPFLVIGDELDIATVISFLRNPTATVNCFTTCTANTTDGRALVATLNADLSCTCSEAKEEKVLQFNGVEIMLPYECFLKDISLEQFVKCNDNCLDNQLCRRGEVPICSPEDCESCVCQALP